MILPRRTHLSDQTLDIIFAMPHPDDVEITCGGTVAKLVSQGHRVGILHMTNGEPTPRGTLETRMRELHEAAEILGVAHVEVLPLTNRELMDCPETRYAVATVFRRHRPRIVVSMVGRTPAASPDHYQGQLIVEAARFCSQLTKWDDRFDGTEPHRIDWLWYRPVVISAEHGQWHSTFVVDVSDVHEQKLAAISAYRSQFDEARLEKVLHRVRSIDGAEGTRCGFKYGELFALPHPWPVEDPAKHFLGIQASASMSYPPRSG
ncbi:MAG: PIG-L family deacetylase [Phycisphaerae bacterium]|nr:PIG-L family deacetylase [Phycisphaerae bacterium]